ncbi:class I SAM-dependent methyltransferase [Mesorhizobium sp. BR1-1-16]|uniref:class I SAM-dependent methyltransferase n=1 Tax=Mesorhizobium sp. BR1-1-16 TaxID=2876653 RepID=UPI001CCFA3F0|nr:class I SAM-dependent methyltransferase [Mesorhizobium sp. BR1-1-16]MBZ9935793.1 class I SAM-dependent methyltransferase [Mesorhizobium sp. BR1-1-16]
MTDGWDESAAAWIDGLGDDGDWSRRHVLDAPMLARVEGRGFTTAIDIGCGEGRFCRMMRESGIRTCGVDPTLALVAEARKRDPKGDYRVGRAEALDAETAAFDLAVSYLSLIDIPGLDAAIGEVHRVLRPGGTFLIANLQSFNTAGPPTGWTKEPDGSRRFYIDHYLDERAQWVAWQGVRIVNWHRPLGTYMQALLGAGFELRHFAEPEPSGADDAQAQRYRRAPYFLIMEWQKAA